jgi:hypothetical protein
MADEFAVGTKETIDNAELIITDEPWDPSQLPPRPWLAAPYLMRGEITLPHGPGGGGKSQLAIGWAISLALCRPFGRLEPKQRFRVVLTNFEDTADEQMRRISAALQWFGASPKDLKGWLYRVSMGPKSNDATMFKVDERGTVVATDFFNQLEEACEIIKPDAVFLDPLVAINAVSENDNQLMRRVMVLMRARIAQHFSSAVIAMHHDNKSNDESESADQSNVRGGTDIVNAVRFELAVKKMTLAQADDMGIHKERRGFYFRLGSAASKLNYSAPEEAEWFQRHAVLIGEEEVVRCEPWQPPSARLSPEAEDAIVAAIERGTAAGPYSPQLGNTDRSLGPVMAAAGIGTPAAQRSALRRLLQAGTILKRKWRRTGHRVSGTNFLAGLQSKSGLPYNYEWQEESAQDAV